jgi:hypothetical protein
VADTCGAGDRFAAAVVLALAGGSRVAAAVRNAVETASEYVGAGGPAALSTVVGDEMVDEEAVR